MSADVLTGDPVGTERGLVVRPIGGGSGGAVTTSPGPGQTNLAVSTQVPSEVVSTLLLDTNANRVGALVQNNAATGKLFLLFGPGPADTASLYSVILPPGATISTSDFGWIQQINGIWDVADGAGAQVTEFTP